MQKNVYVIGHKNPDTDSVCAAITYAHLKALQGAREVIPCRAGELNAETKYVLDYFQQEEPAFLPDLHVRVRDLLHGPVVAIQPQVSLSTAWQLMSAEGIKTLPVVDDSQRLLGLFTVGDVAGRYMSDLGEQELLDLQVPVVNVLDTLSGTLLVGQADGELRGNLVVGAMHPDTIEQILPPGCIVMLGDREEGQLAALETGASCLILTGGAQPSAVVAQEVAARGTTVISVPMDTFSAARLMLLSIPVGSIMRTENLLTFEDDDLLDEVKQVMLDTRYRSYPVVDQQHRVVGSIARYHILSYNRKQVILVDHNEFSQGVDGLSKAEVLEIIDHHKVGGMQTGEPILFRNEPLGSTCTLIAKAYYEAGLVPSPQIAGLLCAAILSDTIIFKSPTCTDQDRAMAERLAALAGIDPLEFGMNMFRQSSSLRNMSVAQILNTDLKEFVLGELRVAIGQVTTMGLDDLAELKPELLVAMEALRQQKGFAYVLLMVTDLLAEATTLLITGSRPELIGAVFALEVVDDQVYLPAVLSRKKQIVPPLVKFFQNK